MRPYHVAIVGSGPSGFFAENVLDILRGGIDWALMGLGKSTIRDLSAADILVPDDFTRALGALGE
jgi:pre-mycofactocin synthase